MFCWALQCRFRQFEKVPNVLFGQALSCLTFQAANFFRYIYIELLYILTLTCMRYLCVSVIHQIMTLTMGSLTCQQDLLMHAYTHIGVRSTPMLPQWYVKQPGHSAKSACGRLHLDTHTPLAQQGMNRLTMPLSNHCVGTYQETSSLATHQRTHCHSHFSLLSHC